MAINKIRNLIKIVFDNCDNDWNTENCDSNYDKRNFDAFEISMARFYNNFFSPEFFLFSAIIFA